MCVFTDKRIKAIAFALVPIVAINVYVGSKMLKKASEKIEVGNQPSIEEMVDQNIIHGGISLGIDESVDFTGEINQEPQVDNISSNDSSVFVDSTFGTQIVTDLGIKVDDPVLADSSDIVEEKNDFSRLYKLYLDSGMDYEVILAMEDRSSDLYAGALYAKLKANFISDDIIKNELRNIIVCGSNATCVSEETWIALFGNLDRTISMYDNVVDYYYPLAKYVHLQECDLEHEPIFFDEFRINCSEITKTYKEWHPEVNIEDYFREIIEASEDELLISKFNRLMNSGLSIEVILTELEYVYSLSMIPHCMGEEEWLFCFGNIEKTIEPTENVCMYYYDLAFYIHDLMCDLDHKLNEFDRYTCEAYPLALEL